MSDSDERLQQPRKKPELTDTDKALLEAEPDWERIGRVRRKHLSQKFKRDLSYL